MIANLLQGAGRRLLRLTLSRTARQVIERRLTYLTPRKLWNLERCVRAADRVAVPGDFIECGVALGGSAIVLASHLTPQRRFRGYDAFEMIPPPSGRDDAHAHERYATIKAGQSEGIGSDRYYGYVGDLLTVVRENFSAFGLPVDGRSIALSRGLFEDTLRFAPDDRIALAHIDCDWYDPVWFSLNAIYQRLSPGGFMIIDDFNDYGGCRRATEAFLASKSDLRLCSTRGNAVIQRV